LTKKIWSYTIVYYATRETFEVTNLETIHKLSNYWPLAKGKWNSGKMETGAGSKKWEWKICCDPSNWLHSFAMRF